MSNLNEIKRRIGVVKNTAKITKAMQLTSALKMKKMQGAVSKSHIYLETLQEVLGNVRESLDGQYALIKHPKTRKNALVVIVGNNRGFVGSQISKLTVAVYGLVEELKLEGINITVMTVKKKSLGIVKRLGLKSTYHFQESYEQFNPAETAPLKEIIVNGFIEGKYDEVYITYTRFESTFIQTPITLKLLPIEAKITSDSNSKYKFEPDSDQIINYLLGEYIDFEIFNIFLNASASEYSARMIAMQKATDNAIDLSDRLTLKYNKDRQALITQQIQENVNVNLT